jgi:hypothetical protein
MEPLATDAMGKAAPPPQARQRRPSVLPAKLPPRLLTREEAAEYMRISPRLFDRAVADGLVPRGGLIYGARRWDRRRLDLAITRIFGVDSEEDGEDPWAEMAP